MRGADVDPPYHGDVIENVVLNMNNRFHRVSDLKQVK